MVLCEACEPPALDIPIQPNGAAIEVRLYAEDPLRDFQPSPGLLTSVEFPASARVDTWVATGTQVSPYYDPMIAKIIVHGRDRAEALARMREARSEEHTSELQSRENLVCRLLLDKKNKYAD